MQINIPNITVAHHIHEMIGCNFRISKHAYCIQSMSFYHYPIQIYCNKNIRKSSEKIIQILIRFISVRPGSIKN